MQIIRDLICKKFGQDIAITITSGYRSPDVNNATKGAAKDSMHIWRLGENLNFLCACDFTVDGSKVDPQKVYEFLKDVLGGYSELIYYPSEGDKHFHYSPSLKKEPFAK